MPFTLFAAWSDLKYMKIWNGFNISVFCLFLVLGLILLPFGDYLTRIGIALAAFVIGFALNALRVMGGGDAKYIAAFIPFVAPQDLYFFFFVLSVCLLAAVVIHRVARAVPAIRIATPDWVSWSAKKFPMGLGLSGGLSFYLAIRAFNLPVSIG